MEAHSDKHTRSRVHTKTETTKNTKISKRNLTGGQWTDKCRRRKRKSMRDTGYSIAQ